MAASSRRGRGFGFESAADGDYRDDLDGDGIEELICNCTYMADGVERVYVFRFRDGRVEEGELDKYEDIVSEEELDGAGQISQRYDPDLRAIVFTYYAEDGDKTLELKDYEGSPSAPMRCKMPVLRRQTALRPPMKHPAAWAR